MAAVANGVNVSVQRQVSQSAGPRNAAPVLRSVPVQPPAPGSQQWRGDATTLFQRISPSFKLAGVVARSWTY